MLTFDSLSSDEEMPLIEFYHKATQRIIFRESEMHRIDDDYDDDYYNHYYEGYLYGLKNYDEKVLIKPLFEELSIVNNEYVLAKKENGCYYVFDLDGNDLYEYWIDDISLGKYHHFVIEGNRLIVFDKKFNEQSRYLVANNRNPFVVLDKPNNTLLYCRNDVFDEYQERKVRMSRYAIVKQNGKEGIISISGNVIVPFEYDEIKFDNFSKKISFFVDRTEVRLDCEDVLKKDFVAPVTFRRDEELYIFYDTETSDLGKKGTSSHIVQISWILTDEQNVLRTENHIIYPDGFTIPIEAQKIHGISTSKAREKGEPLKDVLSKFKHDFDMAKYIVGHNVEFDNDILAHESKIVDIEFDFHRKIILDTMHYGKYLFDDKKWPKLVELYKYLFKNDYEDAHNALSDVKATYKCFWKMRKMDRI